MFSALPEIQFVAIALAVGFVGGVVKGIVGFALPIIVVSGLSLFFPPHLAIAGLVIPSMLTNTWQALRQGPREAAKSLWKVRILFGVSIVTLFVVAGFVPGLPETALYLSLGVPVALFSLIQMAGWRPQFSPDNQVVKVIAGALTGLFGGLAGVVAPPVVVYLNAVNTPKVEHVRTQGVVFALFIMVFTFAHFRTGFFQVEGLVMSAILAVPALIGTYVGFSIQDRVDQQTFQKLTLIVLLLAGLNLIRRGVFG